MGLKCSLLGHSFEPADRQQERSEEGDEVVTVVREIERCVRCGTERVVSENTEVTAVVEADEVGLEEGTDAGTDPEGGPGGAVDRSGAADGPGADPATEPDLADRDPEEEDAEILTDDGDDRPPGQWPEEPDDESWEPAADPEAAGDAGAADPADPDPAPEPDPDDEALSRITVPEGTIVCPECGFQVDADSAYRGGDPCPECGAWLTDDD